MISSDEVGAGYFLLRGGASLPPSLVDGTDQPFPKWNVRRGRGYEELRKQLQSEGWVMYTYAGTITTSGFASTTEGAAEKALAKLKRIVESRDCNCIEIVGMGMTGIKGLRLVTIAAHSRHIQRSVLRR